MKRLLLDTHAFLWWLSDDPALPAAAKNAICDGQNEVYISAATSWEISIKKSLGKLKAPDNIAVIVEKERFLRLPITLCHGDIAGQLPLHHSDPFDRMLIAQARAEGLIIVTCDQNINQYEIYTLWA